MEKIGIIPLTPHSTITDIIGLEVRKLPIHVASFTKLKGKERTGPLPPYCNHVLPLVFPYCVTLKYPFQFFISGCVFIPRNTIPSCSITLFLTA